MDIHPVFNDYFSGLLKVLERQPLNKCMFCKLRKYKKVAIVYNKETEKIEVKIKCECTKEKKIIEINNLFEQKEFSITQSDLKDTIKKKRAENKLFNQCSDLLKNNYLFIRRFIKIIKESGYTLEYKKLFSEKIVSAYNANLKTNIDCYKILHFLYSNDMLSTSEYNLNLYFGLNTSFYPIEDTVDIIVSYLKYNYIINLNVEHHYSPKNLFEKDFYRVGLFLFDGRIIIEKSKTHFIVFRFDSKQGKLIFEKKIKEYLGLEGRYYFQFIQLPNGAVCSYSNSSTIIYDEKTFELIYSDCRHDLYLMKNFSNGLVFMKRKKRNELWVGNKANKGIKYVTTLNFDVNVVTEIPNNKSLFGLRNTVHVYNLSTLQNETIIQWNNDYHFYTFNRFYFNFSSLFRQNYTHIFYDDTRCFFFDVNFRPVKFAFVNSSLSVPIPLHNGRFIQKKIENIYFINEIGGEEVEYFHNTKEFSSFFGDISQTLRGNGQFLLPFVNCDLLVQSYEDLKKAKKPKYKIPSTIEIFKNGLMVVEFEKPTEKEIYF